MSARHGMARLTARQSGRSGHPRPPKRGAVPPVIWPHPSGPPGAPPPAAGPVQSSPPRPADAPAVARGALAEGPPLAAEFARRRERPLERVDEPRDFPEADGDALAGDRTEPPALI